LEGAGVEGGEIHTEGRSGFAFFDNFTAPKIQGGSGPVGFQTMQKDKGKCRKMTAAAEGANGGSQG